MSISSPGIFLDPQNKEAAYQVPRGCEDRFRVQPSWPLNRDGILIESKAVATVPRCCRLAGEAGLGGRKEFRLRECAPLEQRGPDTQTVGSSETRGIGTMLSAALASEEGHVPHWLSLFGTSTSEGAAAAAGPSVSEETGGYSELDVGLALPMQRLCLLVGAITSWFLPLGKLPMNVSHKHTRSFKGCGGGEGLGRLLSS